MGGIVNTFFEKIDDFFETIYSMHFRGAIYAASHKMKREVRSMFLKEMKTGEEAILLAAPPVLPQYLRPGCRVRMVTSRPELTVVESEGRGFALSERLASRIVVVRAPT